MDAGQLGVGGAAHGDHPGQIGPRGVFHGHRECLRRTNRRDQLRQIAPAVLASVEVGLPEIRSEDLVLDVAG
jgi:hypothetical protein